MEASEAMVAAAMATLRELAGLAGVHEAKPVQAAWPHAVVEAPLETDWGYKGGEGRELKLSVKLRDRGERATRLRTLAGEVKAALTTLGGNQAGWWLVSLVLVRSMTGAEEAGRWTLTLDYRARLLRT